MNADNMKDLAKIRFERAQELIVDAENLLKSDSYKSANNRAYYASEKAIKAALAVKGKDSESHTGVIKTFNMEFIRTPCNFFDRSDLSILQGMERIRTASDYDDFYIANKTECEEQVRKAKNLMEKVEGYLRSENVI